MKGIIWFNDSTDDHGVRTMEGYEEHKGKDVTVIRADMLGNRGALLRPDRVRVGWRGFMINIGASDVGINGRLNRVSYHVRLFKRITQ